MGREVLTMPVVVPVSALRMVVRVAPRVKAKRGSTKEEDIAAVGSLELNGHEEDLLARSRHGAW